MTVQQLITGNRQTPLQPHKVIGVKEQIQITAAAIEASNGGMTAKIKPALVIEDPQTPLVLGKDLAALALCVHSLHGFLFLFFVFCFFLADNGVI